MNRPALFLLLYSELLVYEGGRTTWLSYFLPLLAASERFREIHVIHMRPPRPEDAIPALPPAPGSPQRFHAASLELHGPQRATARFRAFTQRALQVLRAEAERGDLLVSIGAHGELLPTLLGGALQRLRGRGLKVVTWLREAGLGQVRARRGRAVHGAFAALCALQLRRSQLVIANGADTAAQVTREHPWLAERLVTIPNGVDLARFAELPPLDLGARPLRLGFVGRLIEIKGFFDFAELARRLDDAPIEAPAWGPAPEASPRLQILERDPPRTLSLHPPLLPAEVPAALGSCGVLVQLTRSLAGEGAGGVSHSLLEALAAGRLVVAWDSPVYRQVLDERSAVLIPEGDVAALERLVRRCLDDPAFAAELSERARRGAELAREYSCERHVERFLAAVEPLLGR